MFRRNLDPTLHKRQLTHSLAMLFGAAVNAHRSVALEDRSIIAVSFFNGELYVKYKVMQNTAK
jgi:hypothetical protein